MEMDELAASKVRLGIQKITWGKSESDWHFYRVSSTLLVSRKIIGLLAGAAPWLGAYLAEWQWVPLFSAGCPSNIKCFNVAHHSQQQAVLCCSVTCSDKATILLQECCCLIIRGKSKVLPVRFSTYWILYLIWHLQSYFSVGISDLRFGGFVPGWNKLIINLLIQQ